MTRSYYMQNLCKYKLHTKIRNQIYLNNLSEGNKNVNLNLPQ
jgi:hypothetical protein